MDISKEGIKYFMIKMANHTRSKRRSRGYLKKTKRKSRISIWPINMEWRSLKILKKTL